MLLKRVLAIDLGNGRANDYRLDIFFDRLPDNCCTRFPRLHQMSFQDAVVLSGDPFHSLKYLFAHRRVVGNHGVKRGVSRNLNHIENVQRASSGLE
jgi:hypothetical protein